MFFMGIDMVYCCKPLESHYLPHIKQPYFSHIKQPFVNGSNELPSLNATCSPSRFFARSTERSAILASTAVTLKPIRLPSLSGFWSPFTWRMCHHLSENDTFPQISWLITWVMSPLNITQPLGIWSIMATIRWCPIYPKWDSYQPPWYVLLLQSCTLNSQ